MSTTLGDILFSIRGSIPTLYDGINLLKLKLISVLASQPSPILVDTGNQMSPTAFLNLSASISVNPHISIESCKKLSWNISSPYTSLNM